MFGSLIYILLDISFNVLYWTSAKTFNGISTVYYYYLTDNSTFNETTSLNENDNKETTDDNQKNKNKNNKLSNEDIQIIKNQITNQTQLIKELKDKINILEEEVSNQKFEKKFNEHLN